MDKMEKISRKIAFLDIKSLPKMPPKEVTKTSKEDEHFKEELLQNKEKIVLEKKLHQGGKT
jgi:hypothetical protein